MAHVYHADRMRALHLSPALHFQPHRHRRRSRCFAAKPAFNDAATQQLPLPPPPPPSLTTPLVDAIAQRGNRTHEASFHVPGHKRGSNPPPALTRLALSPAMRFDLTELEGLDNLAAPEGPIAAAQALAAQAWGAEASFFLVNGTSVGIHAAVMALCSSGSPNSALVLARNAHQSAFNAAALAGCAVEYAAAVQAYGLAHHVTPEALDAAFRRAKARGLSPAAALVVSPTYFGVVSDVAGLVAVCRRHGAMLIVDEAHGAHLRFVSTGVAQKWLPDIISTSVGSGHQAGGSFLSPSDALQGGADVVIQSTHKQLGALTQGAMLHLGQAAAGGKVARTLRTLQTSSPSYLIMASLDAARAQAQDPQAVATPHAAAVHIHTWFAAAQKATTSCNTGSSASSLNVRLLGQEMLLPGIETCSTTAARAAPAGIDPWRFTVILEGLPAGVTGWDAAAALERERGVVAELATRDAMVFAVGMGTTAAHAAQLTAGLEWLTAHHAGWAAELAAAVEATSKHFKEKETEENGGLVGSVLESAAFNSADGCSWPEAVLSPRQALAAPAEAVPWEAAVGRVSAELLSPYPPGVPAVCPGEQLAAAVIERLRAVLAAGGKVVGAEDETLQTLRVAILSEEE